MDSYMLMQDKIKALRARKMTWQDIADLIGVNKGLLWNIAEGNKDSNIVRHYFDLPLKMVKAMPCIVCGELHVKKTCSNKKHKKQYRISLQFDNEFQLNQFKEYLEELGQTRKQQSRAVYTLVNNYFQYDKPIFIETAQP